MHRGVELHLGPAVGAFRIACNLDLGVGQRRLDARAEVGLGNRLMSARPLGDCFGVAAVVADETTLSRREAQVGPAAGAGEAVVLGRRHGRRAQAPEGGTGGGGGITVKSWASSAISPAGFQPSWPGAQTGVSRVRLPSWTSRPRWPRP